MFKVCGVAIRLIPFLMLLAIRIQAVDPGATGMPKSGIPSHLTTLFPGKNLSVPTGLKNIIPAIVAESQQGVKPGEYFKKLNSLVPVAFLSANASASGNFFTDAGLKQKSKFDILTDIFWKRNYFRAGKIWSDTLTWKEYLEHLHAMLTEINSPELEFLRSYRPVSLEDGVLTEVSKFELLTESRAQKLHPLMENSPFGKDIKVRQEDVLTEEQFSAKHALARSNGKDLDISDYEKYIRWLIIKHVGNAGLAFLVKVEKCTDVRSLAWVGWYWNRSDMDVHVNTKELSLVPTEYLTKALGHEIVGHFRDNVVATIIEKVLLKRTGKRILLPIILPLLNKGGCCGVDLREKEYNADVQGFLSGENAVGAQAWLNYHAGCIVPYPYTSPRIIARNIDQIMQQRVQEQEQRNQLGSHPYTSLENTTINIDQIMQERERIRKRIQEQEQEQRYKQHRYNLIKYAVVLCPFVLALMLYPR